MTTVRPPTWPGVVACLVLAVLTYYLLVTVFVPSLGARLHGEIARFILRWLVSGYRGSLADLLGL